ncbi:MAG: LytTR family DNA-binding domain-containing protein [Candidatus Eisenbacteria bacterium]
MSPLRVLIADDEPLARSGLAQMVARTPGFEVIAECADGIAATRTIRRDRPDLVLLDVQMPGADGFSVLSSLDPDERPLVIFVTAYDEHALRAFDVHAVDYVLKPVVEDRLRDALARAAERRSTGTAALTTQDLDRLRALLDEARSTPYLERFLVRAPTGGTIVPLDEVVYLEADGDYVRLHRRGSHELMRTTLRALLHRLDPAIFVRIHRSFAVRIDQISKIHGSPSGDGTIELRGGIELPLSRTYRETVFSTLERP